MGIGTTNPAEKLEINGNLKFSGASVMSMPDNNAASLDIKEGANSYLKFVTTDAAEQIVAGADVAIGNLQITQDAGAVALVDFPVTSAAANNTEESYAFQIDSATLMKLYAESDGAGGIKNTRVEFGSVNVGIDTTAPSARLQIKGAGTGTGFALRISDSTPTDRFAVLDNGNVGIGTTGPGQKLSVAGTIESTSGGIKFPDGTTQTTSSSGAVSGTVSYIPKFTGATAVGNSVIYESSSNVGIGITAPDYNLDVSSDIRARGVYRVGTGAGTFLGTDNALHPAAASGYLNLLGGAGNARISLGDSVIGITLAGGAEKIRINSDGNIGIGTTNPTEALEVSGAIKLTGRIRQGSLGDLAEMMPLSACVLNPVKVTFAAPEALAKGENDKTPLIIKNQKDYKKYVLAQPEAGDVVVISEEDGGIRRSYAPFATNVVGIISTNPAQVLRDGLENAAPVVLSGIVPCKVTAENGAIKPGDLLVSSTTPGHAMKAGKNPPAGTVIGKALKQLDKDVGVVEVIVMMQ